MNSILLIAGAAAILYGLHRVALWMESKGWIYYVKKRASPNALGNALLELQQIVEPDARHVVEMRRKQDVAQDRHGAPPTPNGTTEPPSRP